MFQKLQIKIISSIDLMTKLFDIVELPHSESW